MINFKKLSIFIFIVAIVLISTSPLQAQGEIGELLFLDSSQQPVLTAENTNRIVRLGALPGEYPDATSLSFSSDPHYFMVGSKLPQDKPGERSTIYSIYPPYQKATKVFSEDSLSPRIVFIPSSSLFAKSGADEKKEAIVTEIRDLQTQNLIHTIPGLLLGFLEKGKYIVTEEANNYAFLIPDAPSSHDLLTADGNLKSALSITISVWDITSGTKINQLRWMTFPAGSPSSSLLTVILGVALDETSDLIALIDNPDPSGLTGKLKVLNIANGKELFAVDNALFPYFLPN